jgi:hypothetical protein
VFNGTRVLSTREASYASLLEKSVAHPRAYHMRNVYVYRFSIEPESPQPSGSINMSRIEKAYLEVTAYNDVSVTMPLTLAIYARSYNVMRLVNGLVELLF